MVVACPDASRLPYEVVIAPAEPRAGGFGDERLPLAFQLLGETVRRLHGVVGPLPLNAWLHDSADWHIELLPRLTIVAGVELGAGWWINPCRPSRQRTTCGKRRRERRLLARGLGSPVVSPV